jgi:hypothetical protein
MSSGAETSRAICSTEIVRDSSTSLGMTELTRDTGLTKYIIDEFGIGMVITITIAAILLCRRRSPAKQR